MKKLQELFNKRQSLLDVLEELENEKLNEEDLMLGANVKLLSSGLKGQALAAVIKVTQEQIVTIEDQIQEEFPEKASLRQIINGLNGLGRV